MAPSSPPSSSSMPWDEPTDLEKAELSRLYRSMDDGLGNHDLLPNKSKKKKPRKATILAHFGCEQKHMEADNKHDNEAENKSWSCSRCTLINSANESHCIACLEDRTTVKTCTQMGIGDNHQVLSSTTNNQQAIGDNERECTPILEADVDSKLPPENSSVLDSTTSSSSQKQQQQQQHIISLLDDDDDDEYEDKRARAKNATSDKSGGNLKDDSAAAEQVEQQLDTPDLFVGPWPAGGLPSESYYTTQEFKDFMARVEEDVGATLKVIEDSPHIRNSNVTTQDTSSKEQDKAIYGRATYDFCEYMCDNIYTSMDETDVFLDIGHGIGTVVLYTAFTRGSKALGIELKEDRYDTSTKLVDAVIRSSRDHRHGPISLRMGGLQEPVHRNFLTETVGRAFVNNFNDVFHVRATSDPSKPTLDMYIAGLFTQMLPYCEIVVSSPLQGMPPSRKTVNEAREKNGLEQREDASFYEVKEYRIEEGHTFLDFTNKAFYVYKYTKLTADATFLCSNRNCLHGNANTPIQSFAFRTVEDEGRQHERLLPVSFCPACNVSVRPKRRRAGAKKANYAEY